LSSGVELVDIVSSEPLRIEYVVEIGWTRRGGSAVWKSPTAPVCGYFVRDRDLDTETR